MNLNLDVISLGELLIDFIPTKSGTTIKGAPAFKKAAGGAPANVAVACSRLGLKSGFIGKVGNDEYGSFLRDTLEKEGVDVSKVYFDRRVGTTLAFVLVDKDGERHFQFHRGADALLRSEEIDEDYIRDSKIFHFGSISLTSEPAKGATMRAVKAAEENGLTITYDPNLRLSLWKSEEEAKKWMWAGLEKANVVKMNEEEVGFMLGLGVEEGAEELLESVDRVFISLGKKGCYYADEDSRGYSNSYKVEVRDTTGTGDGFMGGVIYGILKGWEMNKIASFSNAVGALTASGIGVIPALPTLNEVLHLIEIQKFPLSEP